FIPLLTLGIPPNAVMALMVGAMTIHGIVPGPQVIQHQPALFWGMIASMWIGNLMLLIINLPLIGVWVRLLKVPYRLMFPAIVVFSFASIVAGHAFVGFFFPGVVLVHQFLSGGCGFKFAVFFQLIHERRSILQNFFFHQRVHTCIGFDEGRVHGLPFAPDHSF